MILAMSSTGLPTTVLLLLVPALALAAEPARKKPAAKPAMTVEVPKIDLGGIGGVPKADGMEAKRADQRDIAPKVTSSDVQYSVEEVVNAQEFTRTAAGNRPVGEPLKAVRMHGRPQVTQQFTTLVRVKATQNVNASIDVVILDPRGDTALSGSGTLSFTGSKTGEVEWLIDWAPTARPSGGDYKMLIRVAGRPMGTWPLKVLAE
jgi:hypothetical protein